MGDMKGLAAALDGLDDVGDCTLVKSGACRAVVGRVKDHRSGLAAEELAVIERAAPPRQFSYSTGRYLAKRALSELGLAAPSIPTHESRRPIWPPGAIGSITHSRRYAISLVCQCSGLAGVGVDLELADRVTDAIAARVTTEGERRACPGRRPPLGDTATFSAKEAVFKAVNPIAGLMVGFKEVEIRWLATEGSFTATYIGGNRENAIIDGGSGAVFSLDGHVGALFWIGA